MQIWVDADACPLVVKEILYRAAERRSFRSRWWRTSRCARRARSTCARSRWRAGSTSRTPRSSRRIAAGDLVITADIPLAATVIERGGHALNPRGEFYTPDNIRERLAMRDLLDELRDSGVQTGGPAPLDQTDRKRFADALDRFLARQRGAGAP